MKRALLTILFSITSILAFGQARLGSTAAQIRGEFYVGHKIEDGYDENSNYWISIHTDKSFVVYYFNSDLICDMVFISPLNQQYLNEYVELYNKKYVIISSTQWKMYSANGIANIRLIFPEDGQGCFFTWNRE